jgi:hypothetical protein
VSLRTALIAFLQKQGRDPVDRGTVLDVSGGESSNFSPEQQRLVAVAVLPDANRAIDIVLENLYPNDDEPGFTTALELDEIEDPVDTTIARKVMAAGAALELVKPDGSVPRMYYVHSDFYKLLASLRAKNEPAVGAVLTNGLNIATGTSRKLAPTELDIGDALDDVASGRSDFVILARNSDRRADYIQTAKGPAPFRLECRIWLNDTVAEHFHILASTTPEGQDFHDIDDVKVIMLHWLNAGRLPNDVKVRNITEDFLDLPLVPEPAANGQ